MNVDLSLSERLESEGHWGSGWSLAVTGGWCDCHVTVRC